MKRHGILFLSGLSALLFAACWSEPEPPLVLPTGVQTMTGTLLPAEITTLRRGSHLLVDKEGQRLCYVESTTVNLRSFEGKEVVIRGVFEPNSDPALLPVLVTQDVTAVKQDLSSLSLPAFGLTGAIPRSWITGKDGGATVILTEGTATPLITIALKKETPLPANGAPFLISGHHAVRQTSSDGKETTSIERGPDLVVLTFTPPAEAKDADLLRAQWGGFLTSLAFTAASSAASSALSSVPGTGIPCGGTAGILCPAGQYCAITDLQENIGHCRLAK